MRSTPPLYPRYPLCRRRSEPQGRYVHVRKISPPTWLQFPDLPARSNSLYRLRYPGTPFINTNSNNLIRLTSFKYCHSHENYILVLSDFCSLSIFQCVLNSLDGYGHQQVMRLPTSGRNGYPFRHPSFSLFVFVNYRMVD